LGDDDSEELERQWEAGLDRQLADMRALAESHEAQSSDEGQPVAWYKFIEASKLRLTVLGDFEAEIASGANDEFMLQPNALSMPQPLQIAAILEDQAKFTVLNYS
jgi:hypothetical protein